jgi:hypothetical protein
MSPTRMLVILMGGSTQSALGQAPGLLIAAVWDSGYKLVQIHIKLAPLRQFWYFTLSLTQEFDF